MKQESIRIVVSTMLLLMAVLSPAVATTYKLVKVTSVEAGKMYVFEQSGRVMNNEIDSKEHVLKTVSSYSSTGLTGNETYVWTLENGTSGYKLKNMQNNQYLNYSGSSTYLTLVQNSKDANSWTFTYTEESNVKFFLIELVASTTRFLGYIDTATYKYRAYTWNSNHEYDLRTPYFITVYQLVEETSDSEDVTLSAAGMATYVSTHDLDYSSVEGLKAYRAKFDGYAITFTSVTQVPANEGVLLKATETLTDSTNYTVPFAAEAVAAWADDYNDFICGTGANVPTEADGHYNYILNKVGEVVGFYKANNKKVAANRAYLSTTTPPPSSSAAIGLAFEDETTGMRNLTPTLSEGEEAVYNLNGQRVNSATKGLYIINGKKVVIK